VITLYRQIKNARHKKPCRFTSGKATRHATFNLFDFIGFQW
jgi:hypothetical protein